MIVEVPIDFTAKVVMAGKRNPDWRAFRETIAIEVPEASEDEAPVACWFAPPGSQGEAQVAVRLVNGVFYAPVSDRNWHRSWEKANPDDGMCKIVSACRHGPAADRRTAVASVLSREGLEARFRGAHFEIPEHLKPNRMSGPYGKDSPVFEGNPSVKKVFENHRAEVEALVRRAASRFVVIAGAAYERVSRPMIVINGSRSDGILETAWAHRVEQPGLAYSATRFDDAVAAVMPRLRLREDRTFTTRERKAIVMEASGGLRPEIVDAALLDFDETKWIVETAAKRIVGMLSRGNTGGYTNYQHGTSVLAEYDRSVLLAFAKLRDALKANASTEELMTLLEAMGDATAHIGMLRNEYTVAEAALARVRAERVDPVDDIDADAFASGVAP